MSSKLSTKILVLLALSGQAFARTCYDNYGYRYHCSGLSNGARIGIGIAVAVVGLLILSLLAFTSRRRRLARNRAFIVNQQQGATPMGQGQWNNGTQGYGQSNFAGGPNYPPATHQTGPGGFVPPPGAPPRGDSAPPPAYVNGHNKYAPPQGPPPT